MSGALDAEFADLARTDASMRLVSTIPGIGPLNATAFVASIGKAETFGRGRDLAAWLGLVPRQMTTGGKPRLLGITKRGNGYLRRMLIHGARAALPSLAKGKTLMGEWLRGLLSRAQMNTAIVALAAKMARLEEQKDITLDEMVSRLDAEANVRIGRSALSVWLRPPSTSCAR